MSRGIRRDRSAPTGRPVRVAFPAPSLHPGGHRRGLNAIVTRYSGERDARHVYGAFDIAVQASHSEGLPIVAPAVGGTQAIMTGGVDGLLVRRGDRLGLAEAIGRLAEDRDLRHRLGLAARVRADDFSPARLAEQTGALYLRLTSGAVAAL